METNITFKSNLYNLLEHRSEDDIRPYDDASFVSNVFDPEKLKKIKDRTVIRQFKLAQEYCISASAICTKAKPYISKETPQQYWVFRPNMDSSENKIWKDTCKCPFVQCSDFELCRPKQKEKALIEIKARKNFKRTDQTKIVSGYPIIQNLNRIFEHYNTNAYALIDNVDLQRRIREIESRITILSYDGNFHYDNSDTGSYNRNFNANLKSKYVEAIPLQQKKLEKRVNPMLEIQRKSNKNKDNEFFKQFQK